MTARDVVTKTTLVDFDDSLVHQRRNNDDAPWEDWSTAPSDKEQAEVSRQQLAKIYPQSQWRTVRKITTVIEIEEV